ncbi:MAG: ABC transporter substrate-binding protein [Acidobacteria bacterium]|nr:ABC transporter substrate-binding protein [Acidobacteriota bacterium]
MLILILLVNCHHKEKIDCISVCLESFPSSFDPRYATDQSSDRILTLTHRGLFSVNEKMEPVGDAAQNFQFVNPTLLRIELRNDIFFSDGKKVASDDVIYTIESILSGTPASPKRSELEVIKEIRKTNDFGFELELKRPFAPLLTLLNFGIVEKGALFDADKIPVGCGLYKIESIKRGKEIAIAENPFSKQKPKTKKILMKVIEDPTIRSLELLRGSLDIVVNDLPYDSIRSFEKKGFNVVRKNGTNYSYIGFNCRKPPLDKKEARQALTMAIQRKDILQNIIRGFGREATGLISPENWAYCQTQNPPYNPKLAEEMLEKINLKKNKNGIRLKLTYKTSMNKISRFIAEAVTEDLKKIGVEVEIQTLEWGTFYEDIKKGNFDLFSLNWIGIKDPDAYRYRFHSAMIPPFGFNRGGFKNEKVDSLLLEGASEPDREKRKQIYKEIQLILSKECPYINLWWPDIVVVSNPRIKILEVPADGNFIFLKDVEIKNHS